MSPPYNNNITALQMRQLRALRGRPLQIINTRLGELVTYPPRNRCLICRYPVSPPVEVCVCCQSSCWPPFNEFFRCPLDARMAWAAWCLSMGRTKPDGTIPPSRRTVQQPRPLLALVRKGYFPAYGRPAPTVGKACAPSTRRKQLHSTFTGAKTNGGGIVLVLVRAVVTSWTWPGN